MAENMDPRTDHTSAVRSRLLNILSLRIQAISSSNVPPKLPNSNASSTLPPLPSTDEPATGTPQNGFTSLPRPPSHAFAPSGPQATPRALTPIVESSSSERDPSRLPVNGTTVANSDNIASSPLSQKARNEETNAPSPSQLSPSSTYSPTEATSVPVTPPLESVSERASIIANLGKPSPVLEVAPASGGSRERPHVSDDDRAKDVDPSSPSVHSLHSSAASPPFLSPATSSDPPPSASTTQVLPRTPSPGLSILTSPHSMAGSPARLNQSFADLGTSGLSTQSLASSTVLHSVPLQPSKLSQDSVQASTDSPRDEAPGIYDEAGVLYFIHQLDQGSLDVKPQPPPEMDGQDVSSGSENTRLSQFVQPPIGPLRPKSASPPPTASSGRSLPPIDVVSHRKPPNQPLPRTPTLDSGLERRPAGARAAPVSNRQDLTVQQPRNGDIRQGRMSQLEDPDADALAALTFLERHDGNVQNAPVPAPVSSTSSPDSPPSSPPSRPREEPPSIVEPDMQPPSPESENASVYRSSFAPSRNAMQRKARSEAQQAAHEAATHRPGRGTAKAKNKPKRGGAWGDSSEEEEDEEEEEEDEDVDSDGQPANPRDDRSVSNYAASLNQRSRLSTPRGPSPLPNGGDLPPQQPQPRPPRNLPPVPVLRGQGMLLAWPILHALTLTTSVVQFMMETVSDLVIWTSSKEEGSHIMKTVSLMEALLLRDQSPRMLPHPLLLVICGVKSSTLDIILAQFPKPTILAGPSFSWILPSSL
jgi:CCR4-NOT transcriptional complex subunit CAF120